MTQGVINNNVSSQYYNDTNRPDALNQQPTNHAFHSDLPIAPASDIFKTIEAIINTLSSNITSENIDNNPTQTSDATTQNMGATNTTSNVSTDQANNETLSDRIIALIEQLLETLQGLMGGGNNSESNAPASENTPSPPITPLIPIDPAPSSTLNTDIPNENHSDIQNFEEMTPDEQKLVMQLYELIELSRNVGDNLEETGNTKLSNLIGFLEQQLDEKWHQTRHDNMVLSLIQFLERYKDN